MSTTNTAPTARRFSLVNITTGEVLAESTSAAKVYKAADAARAAGVRPHELLSGKGTGAELLAQAERTAAYWAKASTPEAYTLKDGAWVLK